MKFLPSFEIGGAHTVVRDDEDATGYFLAVAWFGFALEIVIARVR